MDTLILDTAGDQHRALADAMAAQTVIEPSDLCRVLDVFFNIHHSPFPSDAPKPFSGASFEKGRDDENSSAPKISRAVLQP